MGQLKRSLDEPRSTDEITTAELAGRSQARSSPEPQTSEDLGTPRLLRGSAVPEGGASPVGAQAMPQRTGVAGQPAAIMLFSESDLGDLRSRWKYLQAGFVDEPRQTVAAADELVANVMSRLAERFAKERASLEKQWDRGDDVSTEDLRIALQHYRSFFDRLLHA